MCVKILSAVRQVINFISKRRQRRDTTNSTSLCVRDCACVNRHDATHAPKLVSSVNEASQILRTV